MEPLVFPADRVPPVQSQLRALAADTCRNDLLRTLGEHSSAIMHEMRAPLAALYAQLQVMEKTSADRVGEQWFQLLYEQIDQMSDYLSQYLFLTGCKPDPPKRLDLEKCLRQTLRLLRGLLLTRQVDCKLELLPGAGPCLGRERQIKQIVINLLDNASAAMDAGGPVVLRLRGVGGYRLIQVRDRGPGLPPELAGRIFDPYFTTKTEGTGLGLPISRQLARDMGGDLTVASIPGQGCTFTLILPGAD